MVYVDDQAARQRPIMIHRAIFGSIERFFGILIENYAGAFPLWLAPVQVCAWPGAQTLPACLRGWRPSARVAWGGASPHAHVAQRPVRAQVRLLTVNDECAPYAHEVAAELRRHGVRAEVNGNASMAKLVRNATKAKTPVTCVVGKQEVENGTLSVRLYQGNKELGALPRSEVVSRLVKAVASKADF